MIQLVYKLVLMDWKKWMKIIKLIWRNKLDNNEWKENDLPVKFGWKIGCIMHVQLQIGATKLIGALITMPSFTIN
jgi:hypothetical protein